MADIIISGGKSRRGKRYFKALEAGIVNKFTELAFADETRDSDRIRALEWLDAFISRKHSTDETLSRLDAILDELRSSRGFEK